MSEEMVVYEAQHQAEIYKMSSNAATLCKEIVLASAQDIKGKKYVRVEGWQAIAIAHGCTASSGEVERTETGFKAIGRVIRMSDGMVLSQAEGFVGDDESTWASRAEYAKRAMAQTRAISRACRSAFAHVVIMMNAGLSTTPAEEVPAEGFTNHSPITAPAKKVPQGEEAKPQMKDPTAPASEKQQKAIHAMATKAGVKEVDFYVEINGVLRDCNPEHIAVGSTKELTMNQASILIEHYNKVLNG